MADNETIADIIAEMRLGSTGGMPFAYRIGRPDRNVEYKTEDGKKYEHRITVIEKVTIDELADRLEAAHKREVREAVTDCNQFSDAAKLREALKLCLRGMCGYCRMDAEARGMTTECVNGCEALLMAKAALAAPPRNCDRFANAEEAWDAYDEWADSYRAQGKTEPLNEVGWLFAPATEGGVK